MVLTLLSALYPANYQDGSCSFGLDPRIRTGIRTNVSPWLTICCREPLSIMCTNGRKETLLTAIERQTPFLKTSHDSPLPVVLLNTRTRWTKAISVAEYLFRLLDSINAERHAEMENSAQTTTVNWRSTPQRTGSFHCSPQASGVREKSFLGGEPETQPLMACFLPGGKTNLQMPIYGPPCITGPHSPRKSRQAQPLMEVRSVRLGVGPGPVVQNLWTWARNMCGESTKWVFNREPFLLF